jgi:hypothetical protein
MKPIASAKPSESNVLIGRKTHPFNRVTISDFTNKDFNHLMHFAGGITIFLTWAAVKWNKKRAKKVRQKVKKLKIE